MGLQGAVLAAGRGTRLHPLTSKLPKPLVPLAGRPLISYSLDHLANLGITTIGINAHHLAEHVEPGLKHRDEEIYIVHEEELQGTGGGIREIARRRPGHRLVVINGDALFDFDLRPVLSRHCSRGALGTLILRYVAPDAPFGRVGVDGSGRLHRVAEICAPGADSLTLFYGAYTGVQILEPELIENIPDGECDILRSAYQDEIIRRGDVFGDFVPPESLWIDVGTPERYLDAHWAILDGKIPAQHLPCQDFHGRRVSEAALVSNDAVIKGPCVVMPGARVESGATVGPYAFIGRRARVGARSVVSRSVVWADVSVSGGVLDEIVIE